MLKDVALSLLCGITVVLLGAVSWTLLTGSTDKTWSGSDAILEVGSAGRGSAAGSVKLDARGRAILTLPVKSFRAEDYPYLYMVPGALSPGSEITLLWRTPDGPARVRSHRLRVASDTPQGFSTGDISGWQGEISELGLAISGRPGQQLSLDTIELQGMTVRRLLAMLYSELSHFTPWQHYSVNTNRGVRSPLSAIVYPLPVVALVLAASLLAYSLANLRGTGRPFDWRVPGVLVLSCWLFLDLFWQGRLIRQLTHTYETFTASDTAGQHLLGIDAALADFIGEVRSHVTSSDRVFVSSRDDYRGMRGAYFLYPHNVFWRRQGPELPNAELMRTDDYIVVIHPSAAQYAPEAEVLSRGRQTYPVELLLSRRAGSLYRVTE